jgi:hypothetical protein
MGASRFARCLIVCALAGAAVSASRASHAQTAGEAPGAGTAGAGAETGQWPTEYTLPALAPVRPSRPPVLLAPVRVPRSWAPVASVDTEDADAASRRTTAAQGEWYGWQTLLVDGSSLFVGVGGLILGVSLGSPAFGITAATLGGVSMFFGAPIVHWVRGHNTRGLVSLFGYRLGLSALGYAVGAGALFPVLGLYALAITGPALAGIGLITGIILDAVFARELPRASDGDDATSRRRASARLMVVPLPVGAQLGLGVVGMF